MEISVDLVMCIMSIAAMVLSAMILFSLRKKKEKWGANDYDYPKGWGDYNEVPPPPAGNIMNYPPQKKPPTPPPIGGGPIMGGGPMGGGHITGPGVYPDSGRDRFPIPPGDYY